MHQQETNDWIPWAEEPGQLSSASVPATVVLLPMWTFTWRVSWYWQQNPAYILHDCPTFLGLHQETWPDGETLEEKLWGGGEQM